MDYFLIYTAIVCLIVAVLLTETKHTTTQGIFALLFLSSIVTHFVINPIELYKQVNQHQFPALLPILLIILFIAMLVRLVIIIKNNNSESE